ncbi:MAG: carboxypeptidase-like regulatory domain-containing protein, partial [Chloroflexota bacterium]|nr:carboxypeptidase-like regulatory domain-containing protein [Chloroflexota bacterium]
MFVSILRRVPFLILALVALAACGAPKVALNGRVIDAYTNQPVKNASLTFGKQKPIQTTEDGSYTTSDWSSKDTVVVEAPGYEAATVNLAEKPELAATEATTVTLETTLRPNVLQGTIKDAFTGAPVANAQVMVSEVISATTTADGSYTLV